MNFYEETSLINIIYGLRRSGKSVILTQIMDEIKQKGINSLRITNQFSIFITGSNSKMTFLELSTDLSGRYVSFRVLPLTFKEIVEFKNVKKEDYKKLLLDIFEWVSLPQRFSFENERARFNYISDVYDSILLKDVVERLNIKDITSFNKIL